MPSCVSVHLQRRQCRTRRQASDSRGQAPHLLSPLATDHRQTLRWVTLTLSCCTSGFGVLNPSCSAAVQQQREPHDRAEQFPSHRWRRLMWLHKCLPRRAARGSLHRQAGRQEAIAANSSAACTAATRMGCSTLGTPAGWQVTWRRLRRKGKGDATVLED